MAEESDNNWLSAQFECTITIRFDKDAGCVVFDLDDMDPWLAESFLRQTWQRVNDDLPYPKPSGDLIFNFENPHVPGMAVEDDEDEDDDDNLV